MMIRLTILVCLILPIGARAQYSDVVILACRDYPSVIETLRHGIQNMPKILRGNIHE